MNNTSTPTTTVIPFKIASMPIGSGFTWFKNGFLLFKAQPWSFIITTAWIVLLLVILSLIQSIGITLATVALPILSFGMADVSQKIRLQHVVSPFDGFSGFHPNHRNRLFSLGVVIAIIPAMISLVTQQLDMSIFQKIWEMSQQKPAASLAEALSTAQENSIKINEIIRNDPAARTAMSVMPLLFLVSLSLLFFTYSPLFLVWQNTSPLRAMLYSVITILKNILPLIVLGCLMLFAFFVISILLSILTAIAPLISTWLILPAICLFAALNYAVIFASYHNIVMTSLKKAVNQNQMSANT